MVDKVLALPEGTRLMLLAPLVRGRKGHYQKLFREIRDKGFTRARVDGELIRVDEAEDVVLERYVSTTRGRTIGSSSGGGARNAESLETTRTLWRDGPAGRGGRTGTVSQPASGLRCGLSFSELPLASSALTPMGLVPLHRPGFHASESQPGGARHQPFLPSGALAPGEAHLLLPTPRESWFWRRVERVAEHVGIDLELP